MADKEKIFDKKMVLQIGMGVLLYFLLRGGDHKVKTENKPVDVKGNDNEVTKGVKVEVNNPALIRIDPSVSITKFFKNSEYFGKKPREVPKEHYDNWAKLSGLLNRIRMLFKKPVLIAKGYSSYPDGKGAVIKPQNGDHSGLWNAVSLITETDRNLSRSFTKLANGLIEVKIV